MYMCTRFISCVGGGDGGGVKSRETGELRRRRRQLRVVSRGRRRPWPVEVHVDELRVYGSRVGAGKLRAERQTSRALHPHNGGQPVSFDLKNKIKTRCHVAFIYTTAPRPSRHGVVWVESAFRSTHAMYFLGIEPYHFNRM